MTAFSSPQIIPDDSTIRFAFEDDVLQFGENLLARYLFQHPGRVKPHG